MTFCSGGIQGEGPRGPAPPIGLDACLRLKFLHRWDLISLFNKLIFKMKHHWNYNVQLWLVGGGVGGSNLPQKNSTVLSEPKLGPPTPPPPRKKKDLVISIGKTCDYNVNKFTAVMLYVIKSQSDKFNFANKKSDSTLILTTGLWWVVQLPQQH